MLGTGGEEGAGWWSSPHGLDQSVVLALGSCQWIAQHHNCLITGPTGVGKSWLASALGHKVCRKGYSVLYLRAARLTEIFMTGTTTEILGVRAVDGIEVGGGQTGPITAELWRSYRKAVS